MMKAAVFDLDGTLLDSMKYWFNAGKIFIEKLGLCAEENLGEKLFEMSMEEGALYIQKNYCPKMSVNEICAETVCVLKDAYRNSIQLKNGVEGFLHFLKSRGIKIALCTNTERVLFTPALKRLNIEKYFDFIFTADEEKCTKSSPEIFMRVMDALGSSAEETFLFEDALYSMKTAYGIGMKVIAIEDECSKKDIEEIKKISVMCAKNFCGMEKLAGEFL